MRLEEQDRDDKAAKHGFLRSHPWLKGLTSDGGLDPERNERYLDVEARGLKARCEQRRADDPAA